jgi:hypothetical protein
MTEEHRASEPAAAWHPVWSGSASWTYTTVELQSTTSEGLFEKLRAPSHATLTE